MRKSLFALENADLDTSGVDLETGSEVAEAADVTIETEDDLGEVEQVADAVEEGTDAAGQMEEVEALVEDAVENGEGLDPVAAEAVRISVEAICSRIGADPKAVYSLYATENFQSASSRKANSRIALEGIKEFLKDLWEKIKSAVKKMWEKMKAFWNKHLSNIGRLRKAVEAMKVKVNAINEKNLKRARVEKAPSSLAKAIPGKNDITYDAVLDAIRVPEKDVDALLDSITNTAETIAKGPLVHLGTQVQALKDKKAIFETAEGTTTWSFEEGSKENTYKVVKNFEASDVSDGDRALTVPTKSNLITVTKGIGEGVKILEGLQSKSDKLEKANNEAMTKIQRAIDDVQNGKVATEEAKAALKDNMAMYSNLSTGMARIHAERIKICVRTAYYGLNYVGFCVKQYKG